MNTILTKEEEEQALADIYAELCNCDRYTDTELNEMARLDEIRNSNHNTPHEL